jgi:diacylglycerol O-acyltransferase / wax synthase
MKIPLGGVDAFHLVTDRVMRRRGLAGNHCLFAVEVDGRLDPKRLERRIERATSLLPELRRRIARTLAGPAWIDTNAPAPPLRVRAATSEIDREVAALVDDRVDGDAPWAVDLLRADGRDVFVWRFFHPLVDAKGAERFVAWLGSGDDSGPADPPPAEERFDAGSSRLAKLDRRVRLEATRAYGDHMLRHARTPIVSLATIAPGPLGRTRTLRLRLSEDETRAFDLRVRQKAKLAETSVMVHASARVYDGILRGRRLAPAQHLVPVPLSLDPKAGATRMFGNHLTMMTFSLRRDDLADLGRAVATLGEQQRAIVREKLDIGMLAALDFAKAVPAGIYHWFLTRPFGGEVSSFVFSNPGAVTLSSFAGLPVRDAYALPSVATPPGFHVIFSRHGGRLSALVGYIEGLLAEAEEQTLAKQLRAELLGS